MKTNNKNTVGKNTLIEKTDETVEQLNLSFGECLAIGITWLQKISTHLENQQQLQKDLGQRFNQIENRLEGYESNIDALQKQQTRILSVINELVKQGDSQDHNIEQIRLLNDGLVRKIEELSQEFIQEYVEARLFKEFAKIYGSILTLEPLMKFNGKDELSALAESIERFLDSEDIKILRPEPGDKFQPREHQPIMKSPTIQSEMNGRVAKTYQPGLSENGRIIQHARVAVFTFKEEPQTQE